jgi:guanylate kinase
MSNERPSRGAPEDGAPVLLVVSAPSGAGKTTLCGRLRAEFPRIVYSVSCTTRAPRPEERDGVDYRFLEEAEFVRRVAAGEFLEHACVHGHYYGTLRAPVATALAQGRDVLMDIDVQGAAQVRAIVTAAPETDPLRRAYTDVFIEPPSLDVLRARLERRGQDSAETIARRLAQAVEELTRRNEYRYLIVNDALEVAYDQLRAVYIAEHCRSERRS